jgi:hypothetical protein
LIVDQHLGINLYFQILFFTTASFVASKLLLNVKLKGAAKVIAASLKQIFIDRKPR